MTELPRFNLTRTMQLAERVHDSLMPLTHTRLVGEAYRAFVAAVIVAMPGADDAAVDTTCQAFVGSLLTATQATKLARWLAGNYERLRFAPAVRQPSAQPTWTPLQILSSEPISIRNRRCARLACRVLAGPLAGDECSSVLSGGRLRYFSRVVGFDKPRRQPPRRGRRLIFLHPRQLAMLYFFAKFDFDLGRGPTGFDTFETSSAFKARNRQLIAARLPYGDDCPRSYTHPCHVCAIGYKGCPLGTHRETYEIRPCPVCSQEDSYFDPVRPDRCVECHEEGDQLAD